MNQNSSLTAQEVADILRITKNTVYELIKRGELRGYKVGKKIRVDLEDVEAYKNQGKPAAAVERNFTFPTPSTAPLQERNQAPEHFVICGQDPLLDILSRHLERHPQGISTLRSYVGSYNGLCSLYFGQVHATATHLWDGDTGQYNVPYVRRLLPGIETVIIRLCARTQGFYVPKGNPKQIQTWEDFKRSELTFINREKGSGTRVLLDEKLRLLGISGSQIRGYHKEELSHLAMASAVSSGQTDFALGNEITSFQVKSIDFIPLQAEYYDLVITRESLAQPSFQTLVEIISSAAFKNELGGIGGYDLKDTGKIVVQNKK